MGQCQNRKKMHRGDTHLARRWRVRSRRRDLDEIDKDLITKSDILLNQCVELDKPGFAQHYCIHCAKYCIDERSLKEHFRTKVHKRRMKALEKEPYSHAEAERAAGHGSYVEPKERVMETQPSKEEYKQGKRVKIELKVEKEMEIEIVED